MNFNKCLLQQIKFIIFLKKLMDLHIQEMLQRKPNRQPYNNGPPNQQSRSPPNMQRQPRFPPQNYNQNSQNRGGQQNFYQRQNERQPNRTFQQPQNRQRNQYNPQYNRNQYQQKNLQSQNQYSQPQQRAYRGQQNQYNNRGQQYNRDEQDQRGGRGFNRQQQPNYQARHSPSPNQGPYERPPQKKYVPKNQQMGRANQYQNMEQQQMMEMMKFMAEQYGSQAQNQPRGRGRGRGSRGRSPTRQYNQHQQPFKSELDNQKNLERMQKFVNHKLPPPPFPRPNQSKNQKPIQKPPKKSFVKEDRQQPSIDQMSQQSQRSYSDQGQDSRSRSQQSRSYSDQQDQGSYSDQKYSDQGQVQQQKESQDKYSSQQQQKAGEIYSESESLASQKQTNAINQMCSRQQFNERLATFDLNNKQIEHGRLKLDTSRSFSVFQINKKTMKPDFVLALKRFKRSADRAQQGQQEVDTKDCRRSLRALTKVIKHITEQIIDADNMKQKDLAFPTPPGQPSFQFIHIYDFLWDRMRQMIKDIMRLPQKDKITKQTITICQQIARFFILSINQGRKKYNSKLAFSQRMNTQSIIKVISNLMEFYRESRMNLKSLIQGLSDQERNSMTVQKLQKMMQTKGIYISPYEPQLSAYSFLFSDDRKKQFYQILTIGFQDQQTQSQNPLINSAQMQKALDVHKILTQKNIQQYFSKIQQPSTDYIFSCMMLKHIQYMRKQISKILFKSSLYLNSQKKQDIIKNAISADTLRGLLRFNGDQTEEFSQFIYAMGLEVKGKLLIWREGYMNQDNYLIPQYRFENDKLDRKNWPDAQTKKRLKLPNKLSRQELIKCSWKRNDYVKQIIGFYMGKQYKAQIVVKKPPVKIVRDIHAKMTEVIPSKQISVQKQKEIPQSEVNNKSKQDNLAILNQKRQELQKKQKRTKFLQKLQNQISDLYRYTDQVKIMNRKKALAILDQWMMYYHDKMLRLSFNQIQNQARKKNLMTNILREIKVYAGIKKQFQQTYNRKAYEYQSANSNNIIPQRTQKGLMSGLLAKAHFKSPKTSYNNLQELIQQKSLKFSSPQINLLLLTTCNSTQQIDKVIFDIILYFVYQGRIQTIIKLKQIKDALKKVNSKEKQIPILRLHVQSFSGNILNRVNVNLKIAKINDVKSRRKAIVQNSHIIQHLFGCNGLFIIRENIKYHATQMILQNFEQFVINNKSRLLQEGNQYDEDEKLKIQTLKTVDLPILLINIMKRSSASQTIKSVLNPSNDGSAKYSYLKNINQVTILQGSTQPLRLPFILKQMLSKQIHLSRDYTKLSTLINCNILNAFTDYKNIRSINNYHSYHSNQAVFQVRPLKQILRQIRINASYINDKLQSNQNDRLLSTKKRFIFSFYQEYFNLCINQVLGSIVNSYKNSIFFKKWVKYILFAQNVLTEADFTNPDLHDLNETQAQYKAAKSKKVTELEQQRLIQTTLQSQPQYNVINQSFKEYQFLKRILQSLKMKFVGENIEPIDPNYFIFDDQGVNIFGQPIRKKNPNQPQRKQVERTLHMTHFINTIGKYLNLFDKSKELTDDKFQNLSAVFDQYGLGFKTFDVKKILQRQGQNSINRNLRFSKSQNQNILLNYQIQGDSLEFFSYLIEYLMEGCVNINVILPKGFKFRLKFQQMIKESMKNLKNVILIQNMKERDVFERLQYSSIDQLKKLVRVPRNDLNVQKQISRYQNIIFDQGQQLDYNQDNLQDRARPLGEEQQISQITQKQYDSEISKASQGVGKRKIDYNYRSIYPSGSHNEGFVYSRAEKLNQLRKKLKQQ